MRLKNLPRGPLKGSRGPFKRKKSRAPGPPGDPRKWAPAPGEKNVFFSPGKKNNSKFRGQGKQPSPSWAPLPQGWAPLPPRHGAAAEGSAAGSGERRRKKGLKGPRGPFKRTPGVPLKGPRGSLLKGPRGPFKRTPGPLQKDPGVPFKRTPGAICFPGPKPTPNSTPESTSTPFKRTPGCFFGGRRSFPRPSSRFLKGFKRGF